MTSSLDDLLARSLALGDRLDVDEAVEINRAILELDPANEHAGTRLAIGLLNRGQAAEAIPVLETVLAAHPKNPFAGKRLAQAQRDLAGGVIRASSPNRSRATKSVWVKAMHYEEGYTIEPGSLSWVSDAGIIGKDGRRVIRADGVPAGEPSWQVGERVGLYFGGTRRVPVLVEIAQRPYFDPQFVIDESGSEEDGRRWPWVTKVRGINALPLEEAPTLDQLEIPGAAMQQRTRKVLSDAQAALLLKFLAP
jgi:tetratricopeptide (TPR) repeat protein